MLIFAIIGACLIGAALVIISLPLVFFLDRKSLTVYRHSR